MTEHWLLFGLTLAVMHASIFYGIKHQNYIVGAGWTVCFFWRSMLYLFQALPTSQFTDPQFEIAVLDTNSVVLFSLILLFLLNGRINQSIDRFLEGLKRTWRYGRRRI